MSLTPMMSLNLPAPSATIGPLWASMLNAAFDVVDAHDHSPGSGSQIGSSGININADLSFNGYALTGVNNVTLTDLEADLVGSTQLYALNGELYYRDAVGNSVQVTTNGAVSSAGSGNISGLVSPASATFTALSGTFAVFADASEYAKFAMADIKLYEYGNSAANPITIQSPETLASAYTLTLPTEQAAGTELLSIDATGQLNHATITGTTNQVTVSASTTSVVVGTVQSIGTSSTPTFGGLTLSGGLTGTTATLSGATSMLSLQTDSGGAFKVKIYTGTLNASTTVTLAPAGATSLYGAYGEYRSASGTRSYPILYGTSAATEGIARTAGATGSWTTPSLILTNTSASDNLLYRMVLVYI